MSDGHDSILDSGLWDGEKESKLSIHKATRWLIDILRPAILTRGGPRKQTRRTAYLDGLRGFAAFLVYWQHHQLWPRNQYLIMGADYVLENGYGSWSRFIFCILGQFAIQERDCFTSRLNPPSQFTCIFFRQQTMLTVM